MARRWIALPLSLLALAVAVLALVGSLRAIPSAGVGGSESEVLRSVLPGGPGWQLDLRPGMPVLALTVGAGPMDWTLTAGERRDPTVAAKPAMVDALRATGPLSALAALVASAGLLLLRISPATAGGAAVVALGLSRPSAMAQGDPATSTAITLVALLAPATWLLVWTAHRRLALALVPMVLAVGGSWLLLRVLAMSDREMAVTYELTAAALTAMSTLLTAGVVLVLAGGVLRARAGAYDMRRLGDIIVVAAAVVAVPVALVNQVSVLSIAGAVAVLLVVYPLTRRRIGEALDRLVLGDLRARSSMEAIERERQRVAREIHDQPLQELAAVIQRLALRPELVAETAMLQEVSGQLRGVTVQLHPPILTDLGLGPSLEFLVDEVAGEAAAAVTLQLDPGTMDDRPPPEVELAAFRIVQEALGNAVRHSGANRIAVRAELRPRRLSASVTDDGVGLDSTAASRALSRGHVGLRSMHERAELVGGELRIENARPGTRVTFRWPA